MRTCIILLLGLMTRTLAWSQDIATVKGLAIGDQAPHFSLLDADSTYFDLTEALQQGPVLVVFYRGQWCPFCNKHLSALNDSLELLQAKGIQVVAISPENPEYLQKMATKTGGGIRLLYDSAYLTARAFDVLFDPGKATKAMINTAMKANMKAAHGQEAQLLPVPGSFLINTDGQIIWRHFEHNYKTRSTVAAILEAI